MRSITHWLTGPSDQCAGIQVVANTGNAQNVISLTQVDGEADDFEFDEIDWHYRERRRCRRGLHRLSEAPLPVPFNRHGGGVL